MLLFYLGVIIYRYTLRCTYSLYHKHEYFFVHSSHKQSAEIVLSLPDGCIGWNTPRAISVHYSLSLSLFPSIPTAIAFSPSQLLSLYHSSASSKAAFQVATTCVIQTPSNISVALVRACTEEILS